MEVEKTGPNLLDQTDLYPSGLPTSSTMISFTHRNMDLKWLFFGFSLDFLGFSRFSLVLLAFIDRKVGQTCSKGLQARSWTYNHCRRTVASWVGLLKPLSHPATWEAKFLTVQMFMTLHTKGGRELELWSSPKTYAQTNPLFDSHYFLEHKLSVIMTLDY